MNPYRMTHLYRRWPLTWLTTCLLSLLPGWLLATHIVGGEMALEYLGPNAPYSHRFSLNLYFDDVNGSPGAEDGLLRIFLYRKRDNAFVATLDLPRISSEPIPYSLPACARPDLRTRLIRYSTVATFERAFFSDPGGYYLVWERCCRNRIISNIVAPGDAGSVFFLEFPAPWQPNGRPFVNSSPIFTPARGDYACVNRPFTFDFSARDADKDSLVYSLVTPYNGYSSPDAGNERPPAQPLPYPPVRWQTGLSATNALPGPVPLRINAQTGLLSVTPGQPGLYVFSVLVDEYRGRQLIGRVRRDFQLKVIDCNQNRAPRILMRPEGSPAFYQEGTVLTLQEKATNCLDLFLTDPDPNQRITLINGSGSVPGLRLTPAELRTQTGSDTLRAQFCFGRCLGRADGTPTTLLLVAADEGCPQGLRDTLLVRVKMVPDPNTLPSVRTNLPGNATRVTAGSSLTFTAFGTDPDNDRITLEAVGRGFDLGRAGMRFVPVQGTGTVAQVFRWTPACAQTQTPQYVVDFIVTDQSCELPRRDTVSVTLTAVGLPGQPPTVRTTLPQPLVELTLSPTDTAANRIRFDVLGDDPDRDTLRLLALGRGFDWQALGMSFTNKTGPVQLQSPFGWTPTCALLRGQPEATFTLDFLADDRRCSPGSLDTTTVTLRIRDAPTVTSFFVPNVFTPNGDGRNDYFAVDALPPDNCQEQFTRVEIVNRWGTPVFSSTDRRFRWTGDRYPAGEYFYTLRFSRRTVKGYVVLLR